MDRKNHSQRQLRERTFRTNRKLVALADENRGLRERVRNAEAENSLLTAIISGLGDPLCVLDRDFKVRFQNERSKEVMGNQQGHSCTDAFRKALDMSADCPMEGTFADGMKRMVEKQVSTDQGPRHLDVATSQRFLSAVIQGINDPLAVFNAESRIVHANDAWARWVNRSPDEILGHTCMDLRDGKCSGCAPCIVEKTLQSSDPCANEKRIDQPSGMELWFQVYTYPISGEDGRVTHVLEYGRDITDRKRIERECGVTIQKLDRLSRTDVLTGLDNRRVLMERMEHEMARRERSGSELSVILCDIDRFKYINDTLGHGVGDEILSSVGEILKAAVRRTDCVGRYGGDEFLLILPDTRLEGAVDLAEEIRRTIKSRTFRVGETIDVGITFSLGVASPLARGWKASRLVKAADEALYDAKRGGRNCVSCYPLKQEVQTRGG